MDGGMYWAGTVLFYSKFLMEYVKQVIKGFNSVGFLIEIKAVLTVGCLKQILAQLQHVC